MRGGVKSSVDSQDLGFTSLNGSYQLFLLDVTAIGGPTVPFNVDVSCPDPDSRITGFNVRRHLQGCVTQVLGIVFTCAQTL